MADKVIPLYSNPEAIGKQWSFGEKGPDLVDVGQPQKEKLQASLSGPAPKFSSAPKPGPLAQSSQSGMMGTSPSGGSAPRAMTPEELSALGDQMLAQAHADAANVTHGGYVGQLYGLDRQVPAPWLQRYMDEEKKKPK